MEAIYDNHNFISVCEFLPNHLYFVTVQNINNGGSCEAIIPHTDDIHFFNTDNELIYHNFYGDFGPLSITCLYKFCKKLTNKLATYAGDAFYEKFTNSRFGRKEIAEKLKEKFVKKKIVIYYTSTNNEKRANAAFLIGAFAVLYLGFSPRLAYKALQPTRLRYRPFQDASVGLSPYKISMKNCLDALHKASIFGFFNFNDFNAAECSHYENIEHGDLNWIIPQKFIAFPGPVEEKNDYYHHPNFYTEYFLCNNVTDIIRLNQRAYDAKCFTMFNIKHHDLYMQDGTDPPDSILKSFMHIAETASGAIAVHCKAGLGRTGSLIGAYLLKHYRMTAKEAIAWIRICRPGSVIGHQQTWLENHEEVLWYEGNEWRYKMYGKKEIVPFLQYGIYSFETPKKEFPGLRDLLSNLTKRSRYRFIVKNKSKKSKTRLQQVIKNLLENGKCTKSPESENHYEKLQAMPSLDQNSTSTNEPSMGGSEVKATDSKNLHYLKPPPQVGAGVSSAAGATAPQTPTEDACRQHGCTYEYSHLEYRKPLPVTKKLESTNYGDHTAECQRPTRSFYGPGHGPTVATPYDGQLQAMYCNPNTFYPGYQSNEYASVVYEKRPNEVGPVTNGHFIHQTDAGSGPQLPPPTAMVTAHQKLPGRDHEMPKIYSEPISTMRYDRKSDLLSKSIDKNWKQNGPIQQQQQQQQQQQLPHKYYGSNTFSKKYSASGLSGQSEEICAFDSRVDTISQYSRFNKSYLNKKYMDQSQMNVRSTDAEYYPADGKLKSGYGCSKSSDRSAHGFLLSPEDLQSWVETFDEKVEGAFGNKKYSLKRSSVV